jgi:hypothetical protein
MEFPLVQTRLLVVDQSLRSQKQKIRFGRMIDAIVRRRKHGDEYVHQ